MFAKFDEILSMILQDIKETKHFGRTVGLSFGLTDGQRENSIPSHKHSLRGGIIILKIVKRVSKWSLKIGGRSI